MNRYFEKYGKPKYAFKMIYSELYDACRALKKEKDKTPWVLNKTQVANMSDVEFQTWYEETVDGCFANELAEAVTKIVDLADSYDYCLPDYVDLVNRYCLLKNPPVVPSSPKVAIRYL